MAWVGTSTPHSCPTLLRKATASADETPDSSNPLSNVAGPTWSRRSGASSVIRSSVAGITLVHLTSLLNRRAEGNTQPMVISKPHEFASCDRKLLWAGSMRKPSGSMLGLARGVSANPLGTVERRARAEGLRSAAACSAGEADRWDSERGRWSRRSSEGRDSSAYGPLEQRVGLARLRSIT